MTEDTKNAAGIRDEKAAGFPWPDGKRCALTLTFDIDAETMWLVKDPKNAERPVTLSAGAYGPKVGVPRILDLLKRFDKRATFFVPGWVIEKYWKLMERILAEGHEIGHHGYLHEYTDNMDRVEEERVLVKGIEIIERLTGAQPKGYRAPIWEFSANTLDLLLQYGFGYSANMMDDDLPYRHMHRGTPTDLIEFPSNWIFDDALYFLFGMFPRSTKGITTAETVYEIWSAEFDGLYREGKLMVPVMHPQLSGRVHRVDMLERLLRYILGHPGVWMTRCDEVADYWREANPTPASATEGA